MYLFKIIIFIGTFIIFVFFFLKLSSYNKKKRIIQVRLFLILISFFLIYEFFFPIHYTYNPNQEKELQNNLQEIYRRFQLPADQIEFEIKDSNTSECFLLLIQNKNLFQEWKQTCYLVFPVHNQLIFPKYLDSLILHAIFLKKIGYNVIVVSEEPYNILSIFLGVFVPEIKEIILNQEIYQPLPLLWSVIEPRVCYYFQPRHECIQYEIIKYIQRDEIFERVKINTKWILNKKDLPNVSKNSWEIFHLIGKKSRSFIKKEIFLK